MKIDYFEHVMLVSHLSAHHAQCLKPLTCWCKHNKTFFPKRYFTFLCNETTSKFTLKQLDYSPSFSMSDSQLGWMLCNLFRYLVFQGFELYSWNLLLCKQECYTRLLKVQNFFVGRSALQVGENAVGMEGLQWCKVFLVTIFTSESCIYPKES